ncbi:hypothetical protein CONCODRAFT_12261 [Conidiobolus coronatus NRRL 28638]|uniref:Uncharacterized protein n=1 Tax=Conidiobolus coronatus (strain ATCC 28846 / CBS 209.66 / NRRL 28638) TaxID=796925 RepID=A0A137NTH3_CONC2|nr:hypothetical protein CONCODRAFT_12261 [Conidiobolus coronatus NRRL 28638]|eukprot:KXN65998.1 hypothetical protein CONCODRAFT_12261 [Conidiobolus coronatus NRRL 28638]
MKFYIITSLLIANIQCAPLLSANFSDWGLFSPKTTSNNINYNAGAYNINAGGGNNNFLAIMQALFGGQKELFLFILIFGI